MDIKKQLNTLELVNEYGTYFYIQPYKYATEDDSGKCNYVYHNSVEISMGGYNEENPAFYQTLTFEQLKELAAYLNERIADIESK